MKRIVVGVDGSPASAAALGWAVAEADRHGADLCAVMAWSYLDQHHAGGSDEFTPNYGFDDAHAALRAAVHATAGDRSVELLPICELPAAALERTCEGADLLVVGARGLGGFKGLLLGSVSDQVLQHSLCPVAVVRVDSEKAAAGCVVVGIDGSPGSSRALHWAAAEAQVRNVPLRVVHAWETPALIIPVTTELTREFERSASSVLDRALSDPEIRDVQVEPHVVRGGATEVLLDLAADAALVVVGSHGAGRLRRTLLGSTSRQVAHHSACPVVVVRAPSHALD